VSLTTPIKIREFQRKLYTKAKQEPAYRFYLLYDKMYREDILAHAYALVKSNQGAPGVDGQTFWGIETLGHDFTFGACSSFTRVTACRVAARPTADFCPEAPIQRLPN